MLWEKPAPMPIDYKVLPDIDIPDDIPDDIPTKQEVKTDNLISNWNVNYQIDSNLNYTSVGNKNKSVDDDSKSLQDKKTLSNDDFIEDKIDNPLKID